MPRTVRNFWATIIADGVKTPPTTGPSRADGGINVRLQVREDGAISDRDITLSGRVSRDGSRLIVEVRHGAECVSTYEMVR